VGLTYLGKLHLVESHVGWVSHWVIPQGQTSELGANFLDSCLSGDFKDLIVVLELHLVRHF
jgi:hypothetical protein